MKYGNLFWGIILITLGVLFAMRNLDIFYFSIGSIFRLWPLVFIFWGIAILPVKTMLKLLLTVITVAIALIILASNPGPRNHWFPWWTDNYSYEREYEEDDYPWKEQRFTEDYKTYISKATLNLDAVAGDYNIQGVTSELFEFETEGNTGPYSAKTQEVDDNTVVIDFNHKSFTGRRNLENTVWINLNENPVWKFNIDVGAAEFDMNLTPFKVEKIDIDGGACAIDLQLGDYFPKTYVNIDAGASDINIKVPTESACEIRCTTILSGKDFDGFNKIKSGLYQTPNFSDSANQIIIEIDAAVSGVSVERY